MSSTSLKLLRTIAPLLFFGLCSCSRPLEGQVFVVTSGAGNYKLGLVPVFILSEEEYDKVKSGYSELVAKLLTAKQETANDAGEKEATLRKTHDAISEKSGASERAYKEAEQQLLAFTQEDNPFTDPFDGEPEVEAVKASQRFIKALQTYGGLMADDTSASMAGMSKALYVKLKAQLQAGTSAENPDVDAIAAELVRVAKDYYGQLKELFGTYKNKQKEYLNNVDAAVKSEKEHNEAVDLLNSAQNNLELNDAEKHRLLAEALLVVKPATKTDGDGEFKLDSVGGANYLIAVGERMVASKSEQYAWIISLNDSGSFSGKGSMILSNDNMSSPDVLLK